MISGRTRSTAWLLVGLLLLSLGIACNRGSSRPKPKPYFFTFKTLPAAGSLVKAPFDVEIEIFDTKTGQPAVPNPPLQISLVKAGGGGNLAGQVVITVPTSPPIFSGVTYDYPDSLRLQVVSDASRPADSGPIAFDVGIEANPTDLGLIVPNDPIPPVEFTLLDGLGSPFPMTGRALSWSLTDLTSSQVVQSGTEPFTGTPMVSVTLSPISVESDYEMTGSLSGSANQAGSTLTVTSLVLQDLPGPFVALKSARVGQTYQDDVSFAVAGAFEWQLLSGALPAGLTIDTATGIISGTPTTAVNAQFTLYARTGPVFATPIRCALAIFSQAETEWVAGQSFVANGPYTVPAPTPDTMSFTSSFDGDSFSSLLAIYHPDLPSITSPLPLYVHHRGRGFNYLDYDFVLTRIASHGFICVSVEDYQSFFSPGSPSPRAFYDGSRADAGMESGSAFQEAAVDHMISRSMTPGDPFEGKIDETKVIVGGHSRGGGATHGSHTRGLDIQINGAIYFMPFDLRYFSSTIPPGVSPAYGIPDIQPRLPSMIFMAENDGDLVYPYADEIIERASGQTTSVTVYGAIHNYLGDFNTPDGSAYITRPEQQDIIVNQVVAFLKRWGEMDISLEGFLYGNEFAGSTEVGIASLRNMVEAVLVDDFQDAAAGQNSLGGANSLTGGSRSEMPIYPPLGSFWSLGIQNCIISFTQTSAVYSTGIPPGTDLTGRKRLLFRCGQTSLSGYDWVTFRVRLTDGTAQDATVTLFDRTAPSTTYLPDFVGGNPRLYDRFVEVQIPLTVFTLANPSLDLNALSSIEFLFDFGSVPAVGEQIYFDDIRFE